MPIKPALQRVLKAILHTEERNENSEEATEKKYIKLLLLKHKLALSIKAAKQKR